MNSADTFVEKLITIDPVLVFRRRVNEVATCGSPNVTHILGYPLEEVVDVPGFWLEHVHPDDLGQSRAKAESAGQTEGTNLERTYWFLHRDGAYRWPHPTARFEYDESGSLRFLSRTGRPYPVDRRELT